MPHQIQEVLNPDTPNEWGNSYGQFKEFEVVLTDGQKASVSKKIKGDGTWFAPRAGDEYDVLEPQGGTFLPKLKSPITGQGGATAPQGQQTQISGGANGQQSTPQRTQQARPAGKPDEAYWQAQNAMKGRSAAQERAVGYLQAKVAIFDRLTEPNQQATIAALSSRRELALLIDWFALDVKRAGDRSDPVLSDEDKLGALGASMEPQADTSDFEQPAPAGSTPDSEVPF